MQLTDIPIRLRSLGRSQASLARAMKLDPSSLVKTIRGERRVQPHEKSVIEEFFGEKLDLEVTAPLTPRHRPVPSRIPLYGYAAAGGDDRIAFADNRVLEWLTPPPFWNGLGDLIYVRLVGDSMEPRYFSGEVVPARLEVPPAKGQDTLIEFNDGTALVKTFRARRDGQLWVSQYSDDKTITFDESLVRALHVIWKPGMA